MNLAKWGTRLFWVGFLLIFLEIPLEWGFPSFNADWIVAPGILCIVIGGLMYLIATVRDA